MGAKPFEMSGICGGGFDRRAIGRQAAVSHTIHRGVRTLFRLVRLSSPGGTTHRDARKQSERESLAEGSEALNA